MSTTWKKSIRNCRPVILRDGFPSDRYPLFNPMSFDLQAFYRTHTPAIQIDTSLSQKASKSECNENMAEIFMLPQQMFSFFPGKLWHLNAGIDHKDNLCASPFNSVQVKKKIYKSCHSCHILSKLTLPYTQGTLPYMISLWRKTGGHMIKIWQPGEIFQFIRQGLYGTVLHSSIQINHVT